jgi:hypothetical protein
VEQLVSQIFNFPILYENSREATMFQHLIFKLRQLVRFGQWAVAWYLLWVSWYGAINASYRPHIPGSILIDQPKCCPNRHARLSIHS